MARKLARLGTICNIFVLKMYDTVQPYSASVVGYGQNLYYFNLDGLTKLQFW